MNGFMIFLVLLMPNTDKPIFVLMKSFDTATECNHILKAVPPEHKDKWACISIDVRAQDEREVKKV